VIMVIIIVSLFICLFDLKPGGKHYETT